jgi:formamidopyrimidine-DNA glycosylase
VYTAPFRKRPKEIDMPELPEVETVVRELRAVLPGREVVRASLTARDLYRKGSLGVERLAGVRLAGVRRKGKAIVVEGDRAGGSGEREAGDVLVVHLGMTGRLEWLDGERAAKSPPARRAPGAKREHLHGRWIFADGSELRYYDPRRFGFVFVGRSADVDAVLRIGPDPFEITPAALARALAGRRASIKALLLDQRVVSGLGNIYVDESLHLARVHPLAAGHLAAAQASVILRAARRVLSRAIRARGTTLRDYRRPDGSPGGFQTRLAVYGREGDACARCGAVIVRVEVAGRGTHYCPRCQRRDLSATSRRTRPAGRSRRADLRRAGYTRSR